MARLARPQVLSLGEIHRLSGLVVEAFVAVNHLRASDPLGACIQYPKIPPILSESLALALIKDGTILPQLAGAALARGPSADVVATLEGRVVLIEVKATAKAGFSHLYAKDTAADHLVWIDFGTFFVDPDQEAISVFTLSGVKQVFQTPQKITLREFRRVAGTVLREVQYPLRRGVVTVPA